MSLQVLQKVDRPTANAILAATALSTASAIGEKDAAWIQRYKHQIAEVTQEITTKLNLGSQREFSKSDQARFDRFLTDEITKTIFQSESEEFEALKNAGQAGLLPPSAYDIVQPQIFEQRFRRFGFRKQVVKDIISEPFEFEHLMTDPDWREEHEAISLFLKKYAKPGKDHWMLAQTQRVGRTLVAQSAWRVFGEDVDLSQASSPLGVLRAFVDEFGLDIRVADKVAKFFELETFPIGSNIEVELKTPTLTETFAQCSQKLMKDVLAVGIAFNIDINKYMKSLQKHGFYFS